MRKIFGNVLLPGSQKPTSPSLLLKIPQRMILCAANLRKIEFSSRTTIARDISNLHKVSLNWVKDMLKVTVL